MVKEQRGNFMTYGVDKGAKLWLNTLVGFIKFTGLNKGSIFLQPLP
jgi:hypothetical protein